MILYVPKQTYKTMFPKYIFRYYLSRPKYADPRQPFFDGEEKFVLGCILGFIAGFYTKKN